MKKALSLLMCYAMGMFALSSGAFGGVLSSAANINFNSSKLRGRVPEYGLGDDGNTASDTTYWFFTGVGNNSSKINYYTDFPSVAAPYDNFDSVTNRRPSYMTAAAENAGLAKISVGAGVLERTFVPVPSQDGPERDSYVDVPDGGLSIDMLVQYDTGFVTQPRPELYRDANVKIGFGMLTEDFETGKGRFFVTAGCWRDGVFAVTNYMTAVEITTSRWYRVTARMFSNSATKKDESYPAFTVYLDGVEVKCADSAAYDDVIGKEAAALFEGDEHFAAKSLFPSMQRPGGDHYADKAYSVAFQGLGYVDEIGVASNVMATATNEIDMVVVCDNSAITQLVYSASVDGEEYANVTNTSGFNGTKILAKAGATITVTPFAAPTAAIGDAFLLGGNLPAVASYEGYTVNFADVKEFSSSERVTATITSKNAYFSVGGTNYTRFADAIAAAPVGGTVKVVQDVNLDGSARAENGQILVRPGQNIVFDLNGKRVKGNHFDEESAIYNKGQLQIIDSIGGGSIEAPGTVLSNDWAGTVLSGDWKTVSTNQALDADHSVAQLIVGEKDSMPFTVRGRVTCTSGKLILRKGQFLTPIDEPNPSTVFYLKDYVDSDGRYAVDPTPIEKTEGWYWTVKWNDEYAVYFHTAHGTVTPEYKYAKAGVAIEAPTLVTPGYDFGGWYEGETRIDFPASFNHDTTLNAKLTPQEYTIRNDWFTSGFPTEYTVETPSTILRVPARPFFTFGGWRDSTTGNYVTNVGAGACFVGTHVVVTGNLDLAAAWVPVPLTWTNVKVDQAESNGTYSGVWKLKIPATSELVAGSKVKITSISFCIVNPTQYSRTSPMLAICTTGGADLYVSAERKTPKIDQTFEYVNVEKLENGRPKVVYDFSAKDALVTVGDENDLFFASDAVGSQGSGFLRLMQSTGGNAVIGNCDGTSPSSPSEAYSGFSPVYEIVGEVQP